MSEDEWVKVATTNDILVAQLLLKLASPEPTPPPNLKLRWSVRQRRSQQVSRKKSEPTRASPTTPLSWSGGTSVSGGAAYGFEESSVVAKTIDTARSKAAVFIGTSTLKRSRKKKTLAELKEEEILLLKERKNLMNKLATFQLNIEKERATNEGLKRMKLHMTSSQMPETVAYSLKSKDVNSNQPHQEVVVACDPTCSILSPSATSSKLGPSPPADASVPIRRVGGEDLSFTLPDLNLPVEDDSDSEMLYGTS